MPEHDDVCCGEEPSRQRNGQWRSPDLSMVVEIEYLDGEEAIELARQQTEVLMKVAAWQQSRAKPN